MIIKSHCIQQLHYDMGIPRSHWKSSRATVKAVAIFYILYKCSTFSSMLDLSVDVETILSLNNGATSYNKTELYYSMMMLIPSKPDPLPLQKIRAAMEPANITDTGQDPILPDKCNVTSQVRLMYLRTSDQRLSSTSGRWIMQAIDLDGNDKSIGGDEFYITYFHHSYHFEDESNPSIEHPTAVARITDMRNGWYELDFVVSPMATNQSDVIKLLQNPTVAIVGGKLTVNFVYTCGIGQLTPPLKNLWRNGGAIQTEYSAPVNIIPPIRQFMPPIFPRVVDLLKFDHVILFGDSLMQQYGSSDDQNFRHNVTIARMNIGRPLNTNTWSHFLRGIKNRVAAKENELRGIQDEQTPKIAVVVGSSTWDILASAEGEHDPEFNDHRSAAQSLIIELKLMEKSHTGLAFFWKSGTPVHSHVVVDKYSKKFGHPEDVMKRILYMSESRSEALYRYQKNICEDENMPFLDIYEAYALSADWHFPTDGRHFRPELNQMIFDWLYSQSDETINIKFKNFTEKGY